MKATYINGYRLLKPFSTAGGGMSKWTFAEKGGREYFLKEFLHPVWPSEGAPGSPSVKARNRRQCEEFEEHNRAIIKAVQASPTAGGNLITTLDFFLEGSKYYKVTEKVDVSTYSARQVAVLPFPHRLLLLTTITHSLRTLHRLDIVHSDLKPGNLLLKQTGTGAFTAKLIDFDSSYFSGKPPAKPEEVVGDLAYYSPELARYMQESDNMSADQLTVQSDMFSLGLLFTEYLTGNLPHFDKDKFRYACVAVNHGNRLEAPSHPALQGELKDMLSGMLHYVPSKRPDIHTVFSILRKFIEPPAAPPVLPPQPPPSEKKVIVPPDGSKLKGTMFKKKE